MKFSDKKIIRKEILGGADINEIYNKYVEIGFDSKKVANSISSVPNIEFIKNKKIFLNFYKIIMLIFSVAALIGFVDDRNFDDGVLVGLAVFMVLLTVIQLYLIFNNYLIGYTLTIIGFIQTAPKMLIEVAKTQTIEDFVGLVFAVILLSCTIYIIIKMFPYAKFWGGAKLDGADYLFQKKSHI